MDRSWKFRLPGRSTIIRREIEEREKEIEN